MINSCMIIAVGEFILVTSYCCMINSCVKIAVWYIYFGNQIFLYDNQLYAKRYRLNTNETIMLNLHLVNMSKYGDQTYCENLDCVGQLEIGQAGYLSNHPRNICLHILPPPNQLRWFTEFNCIHTYIIKI